MQESRPDIKDTMNIIGSGVKLVFDAFDRMRDVRHDFELSLIYQLKETVGVYGPLAEWIQSNLDLISTVVEGQHAQERELAHQLKQLIVGVGDLFIIPHAPPRARPGRPASPSSSGVRVTVRQDQGRVVVPITLHNHQDTSEFIRLQATPLREVGSTRILTDRIRFEPPQLDLAGGNSAQVRVVIDVSPEFQHGRDYVGEIHIDGSRPRSLPVQCTVLPADVREASSPIPASPTLARREVRATVYQNQGLVVVPITLHNHQDTSEFIRLQATPLQEVGSTRILTDRIRFEPPQLELARGDSAQVRMVIDVSAEFQHGKDYVAEVRIGGSEPEFLWLRFTVLPASIEDQRVAH